ncbi:MAG TPA: hypothetical protein DDW52_13400 [Planctomycetaceae bacterium]|nr:hypothetical protein [Planctomycetaceae bacterium]
MTRLYERLVITLMPPRLLDAMHVVYEECAQSCNDRVPSPEIHPIETMARWLRVAHSLGWTPPERPIPCGPFGSISGIDDGSHPSWLPNDECFFEELN